MKQNKLHITILSIFIWGFSFAQQYTNYSINDGLPSNHVYTILQDAKGFMWFLTDKGMVKYNGKTFKTFTTKDGLPNNDVWDAFTTPDGKVWYLTKSTHLGYIENNIVQSFPNQNKNEVITPINSSQINNIIYPGGTNKFFKLKDRTWQNFNVPKIKINGGNYSRVINKKVGFIGYNYIKKTLTIYNNNEKLLKKISIKNDFKDIIKVRGQITDSLFFWASNKGYSMLNLNNLVLKQHTFKEEIGLKTIKYPRINLVGKQLQITGERFVSVLDEKFKIKNPFFFPSHIKAHFGFIDSQNTIWLSTFNNGIYKLPYSKQQVSYAFEGGKIQKLSFVKNELFLGVYNKGVYKYNNPQKSFEPYLITNDFVQEIKHINELNVTFLLNRKNIVIEENNKRKKIKFSLKNNSNIIIDEDLKKVVFFDSKLYGITSFGIIKKLDIKTFVFENKINHKGINDILIFNSRFIIATTNGLKEVKKDAIKEIKFYNSIFDKSILSIKQLTESQILINTDGYGSYISNLETISPLKGSEFLIVQDAFIKDNSFWLATNTGVLHFEKTESKYHLIRTYTINDGLPNNNVNTLFVDKNQLMVGTDNGLAIVPLNQKKQNLFVDVFIKNGIYNKQKITDTNTTFRYKSNNNVRFEANTINFSEDNNTSFYYKLEPIQKEWVSSTTNVFNFNNLLPKEYTFHLKSGDIKKQLSFTITPLWYQTLFFKVFTILILLILTLLFNKWNKKRIEKKSIEKAEIKQKLAEQELYALRSQMNPHFVFNSLNSIQYFITKNENDLSEKYLVKFAQLIRMFFDNSSNKHLTLENEIDLLKRYLEIEKLRFGEDFKFKFDVDDKLNRKTLIPTMLLQPIVENAVNHGIFHNNRIGNLLVSFIYIDTNKFKVSVIDDGIGIKRSQEIKAKSINKHKSKSTTIISDRIQLLNQSKKWAVSMKITDLTENNKTGTKVDLTFKIIK